MNKHGISDAMTSDAAKSGGCICGAVRYEVSGPGDSLCYCHCTSCRRATGAMMVAWVTFPSANFTVTKGQLRDIATSAGVIRGHCAACGSSLTYRHEKRQHEVDVTTATLDDPGAFAPTAHIWVMDKLPWVTLNDDLPRYETTKAAPKPKD